MFQVFNNFICQTQAMKQKSFLALSSRGHPRLEAAGHESANKPLWNSSQNQAGKQDFAFSRCLRSSHHSLMDFYFL